MSPAETKASAALNTAWFASIVRFAQPFIWSAVIRVVWVVRVCQGLSGFVRVCQGQRCRHCQGYKFLAENSGRGERALESSPMLVANRIAPMGSPTR
jgi:hypothetical protein